MVSLSEGEHFNRQRKTYASLNKQSVFCQLECTYKVTTK